MCNSKNQIKDLPMGKKKILRGRNYVNDHQKILTSFSTFFFFIFQTKRRGMRKWGGGRKKTTERGWSGREKRREEVSLWAVIRGSQQGGQRGLVGSEKSSTKQPSSSLAASLRGTSQAYLSSRLLNRLTSGSHPTHTHTHSPLSDSHRPKGITT